MKLGPTGSIYSVPQRQLAPGALIFVQLRARGLPNFGKANDEQLQKARLLVRNVIFSLIIVDSEEARLTRALTLREQLETFREFCGLTGWQKVMIIGQRRDELRERRLPHKSEDVAQSLSFVQWGPGRAVAMDVAQKILTVWRRVGGQAPLTSIIHDAQAMFV